MKWTEKKMCIISEIKSDFDLDVQGITRTCLSWKATSSTLENASLKEIDSVRRTQAVVKSFSL